MEEQPSRYYSEDYGNIEDYDNTNDLLGEGQISNLKQFELFFRVADDRCEANCPNMFSLVMGYHVMLLVAGSALIRASQKTISVGDSFSCLSSRYGLP